MLIDKGSDVGDLNSFPFLKTLLRSSSLSLEMSIRAMEIWPNQHRVYSWSAIKSNGALSFIEYCYASSVFSFKQLSSENFEKDGDQQNRRILGTSESSLPHRYLSQASQASNLLL